MTPAEQTAFHEMRELPKEQDSDDWIMLDDVLDGSIPLDMSDFFSLRNIHRVDHRTETAARFSLQRSMIA